MKESDGPANEERKRLGMSGIHTVGWHVPPHYDLTSKRLEWGVRLRGDGGGQIVNYTIRLLGRRGVMHATLVSDPERLDRDIADQRRWAATTSPVASATRSSGPATASRRMVGLAALVLGGAAAVATKSGFGKAIASSSSSAWPPSARPSWPSTAV